LSAATPKKKIVKFEVNSEEFLRVAHPSIKQGTERFSKRFSSDFEFSDPQKKFVKFEINSEEFLRVAHPSSKGSERFLNRFFLRF